MLFNVAQQLREPIGAVREYPVHEPSLPMGDAPHRTPVDGSVRMVRTARGLLVRATLQITLHERCARCLIDFDRTTALTVEEEFFSTVDIESGTPLPLPEDASPEAFRIDPHHHLDLTEAVRQYRVMAESLAPRCRPDCRGLCLTCGQNLNLGPCSCPPEAPDPRWRTLAQLVGRPRDDP